MTKQMEGFSRTVNILENSIAKLKKLQTKHKKENVVLAQDSIEPLLSHIKDVRQSGKDRLTLNIVDLGLMVDMIEDYQLAEEQIDTLLASK